MSSLLLLDVYDVEWKAVLLKSEQAKQEINRTVILPLVLSVLWCNGVFKLEEKLILKSF